MKFPIPAISSRSAPRGRAPPSPHLEPPNLRVTFHAHYISPTSFSSISAAYRPTIHQINVNLHSLSIHSSAFPAFIKDPLFNRTLPSTSSPFITLTPTFILQVQRKTNMSSGTHDQSRGKSHKATAAFNPDALPNQGQFHASIQHDMPQQAGGVRPPVQTLLPPLLP